MADTQIIIIIIPVASRWWRGWMGKLPGEGIKTECFKLMLERE
jgi:hypothetical protein